MCSDAALFVVGLLDKVLVIPVGLELLGDCIGVAVLMLASAIVDVWGARDRRTADFLKDSSNFNHGSCGNVERHSLR